MRFLIGIITGTILTLFIATAVDAPTQETLSRSSKALSDAWKKLIDKTSTTLFSAEIISGEPAALPMTTASDDSGTTDREPEPAPAPADDGTPMRAAEPVAALAPPEELPPPPPVHARVPDPDPVAPFEEELRTLLALSTGTTAGVWAPFHSQRSAEGFAARLARELDHDFRVERRGAGAYQVVFDAGSPAEREAVLADVAEITGQ